MPKIRVAVIGSVGKSVLIDTDLSPRVSTLEVAVAALQQTGVSAHKNLTGLQVGDDHPQYTMWQAPETIKAPWNFTAEPSINGDLLTEFIQDKIGTILVDSTSIDFTYSDATPSITAAVITANPSGLIGMSAVNGTATTPPRSDGRHAIDPAIAPTWTATHTFNNVPVVPNDSWAYAKIQDVSATNRVLGRMTAGAGDIEELTAANLATIIGTALGANPSASIGLTAIPGTAGTYMRSDGAPALSQAITPTWTGSHIFGNTTAQFVLANSAAPLDQKFTLFRLTGGGGGLRIASATDAAPTTQVETIFSADRTAAAWTAVFFGNIANNPTFGFLGTGAVKLTADNQELQLGAGPDLRLFHDGTDSWIRNDTGILKVSSGATSVFEITAARGTFNVPFRSKAYTVATLPAGTQGDRAHVTDALAPAFLTAVVGGGAVVTPVFYNGTNWVAL